jgi:hypothetical protein
VRRVSLQGSADLEEGASDMKERRLGKKGSGATSPLLVRRQFTVNNQLATVTKYYNTIKL